MSNVSQTSNAEKADLIFTCKFVKKKHRQEEKRPRDDVRPECDYAEGFKIMREE